MSPLLEAFRKDVAIASDGKIMMLLKDVNRKALLEAHSCNDVAVASGVGDAGNVLLKVPKDDVGVAVKTPQQSRSR